MLRKTASTFLLNSAWQSPLLRSTRYSSSTPSRVAVILSGCGVYDGTEIHEAASVLSHLTRNDAVPCCFAPDMPQLHVINHLKGEEDKSHKRNILVESSRIARGNIQALCKLIETQSCYDALILPGGFGAAKNLSDYAINGINFSVHPEVEQIVKDFHCAKKPIAFICISPMIAAKIICNVNITLGRNVSEGWPHRGAIDDAKKLGALVEDTDVSEFVFDKKNIIFSTPAFMYDGLYHEIDDGIGVMIKFMMNYIKQQYKN